MSFLAQHRLRPGATVFDCGAFQCLIAMILAKFVGATGKVVAVEASRHNYEAAIRNCRLNDARNLDVINAAVSDTSDPVEFNCRANGQVDDGSGAWGKIAVPSVSVDELTRRYGPPDVLFVDVEGFESKVMRGAADTLSRYRPDCFFEMHVGCGLEKFDGSVKSITDSLKGLGYHLWMGSPELNSFSPFSEQLAAGRGAILPHRNHYHFLINDGISKVLPRHCQAMHRLTSRVAIALICRQASR